MPVLRADHHDDVVSSRGPRAVTHGGLWPDAHQPREVAGRDFVDAMRDPDQCGSGGRGWVPLPVAQSVIDRRLSGDRRGRARAGRTEAEGVGVQIAE